MRRAFEVNESGAFGNCGLSVGLEISENGVHSMDRCNTI